MIKTCTVGNYSVSFTSGTGISGVLLNVTVPYMNDRLYIEWDRHFNTQEEADAYCLEQGYIQVYSLEVSR